MTTHLQNYFKLKQPCENCPFRKSGALDLLPGRLDGIIEQLVVDDHSHFQCHKTVHSKKTGGHWDDEGNYAASGRESMCAGAMIYLEKYGRPTVPMRLGRVSGIYSPDNLKPFFHLIIDPES